MAPAPTRSVHFFRAAFVDTQGSVTGTSNGTYWSPAFDHVKKTPAAQLSVATDGGSLKGRVLPGRHDEVLYVGRDRRQYDWPEAELQNGNVEPLNPGPNVLSLLEPAYMLPIAGTGYIAVLRSTAGPTWSQIGRWMTEVLQPPNNDIVVLQPYSRGNLSKLFADSELTTWINVGVDPGAQVPKTGQLSNALRSAQAATIGSVSVDVRISFGRARPDNTASKALADEFNKLLKVGILTKAVAGVRRSRAPGKPPEADELDFMTDRIVYKKKIVVSADGTFSEIEAEHVLRAAVSEFRAETNI